MFSTCWIVWVAEFSRDYLRLVIPIFNFLWCTHLPFSFRTASTIFFFVSLELNELGVAKKQVKLATPQRIKVREDTENPWKKYIYHLRFKFAGKAIAITIVYHVEVPRLAKSLSKYTNCLGSTRKNLKILNNLFVSPSAFSDNVFRAKTQNNYFSMRRSKA